MGKNSVYAGSASSRILRYNHANNIFPGISASNSVGNAVSNAVSNAVVRITNRILFAIDEIFEPRFSTMIKYLIDIGYVLDTLDFVVVKTTDNIINLFTSYYNKGYRLFFAPQKSSVFISLIPFFTKYTDAVYFNSGSTIYLENNQGFPSNMIRTSANVLDNVNFIMKNIVFNFKSKIDLLEDSNFNNLFDYLDTGLVTSDTGLVTSDTGLATPSNLQVFNQVVYICDSTNFTGQQYIDIFGSVIASYCPGKVSLKYFILDIANDKYMFNSELDALLSENPIDGDQFAASLTKNIFVIKCTNDLNFQYFLNYFQKPEYYKNVIVFNEKFINSPGGVSYYSKYDFTYGFILSGGFSELGYKLCNNIFGDHDIGGEVLAFVDIFTFLPNIYNKVVASGNLTPGPRLLEYLNNLGSINNKQWHVKASFLYKLDEIYNETTGMWDFNSDIMMFNKSFNPDTSGVITDGNWIDTVITGYPTATGAVSYTTNLTAYNAAISTFFNSALNGQMLLFSTLQEITDYTTKLQTFFSGAPSPNSTPSVFGIWKMLANKVGWPTLDPFSQTVNGNIVTSINIKVVVPAAVLIDESVENKNYWLNINSGPYNYVYRDVVAGVDVTDSITIDQVMTFSNDNYLLVFNKGNLYAGGIRGPLLVYFKLVPQKISVDYKIGDVVYVDNCDIGQNINAVVDGITKSNTSYTLRVSKFEKENSTDVLITDRNKGKQLTFSAASASASASNRLFVTPSITNSSNKGLNCWSLNGCYYLALLPSGNLVANDYRSGATFWSSNTSNASPDYLEFFVNSSNHLIVQLVNLLDDNTTVTYATIYDSVVTNLALLVYPLQLTITDDRQIVIVNNNGALLYSLNNSKKIRTSLSSGDTITVDSSESNKLYSANGWHSLSLSDAGVLSFNDESLTFDSGLVTQLYSGYLNGNLTNLSNGTLALNSSGSCTLLDSFASILPASTFSLSIYTFVLSGFFLAPSAGSYTFSLTSVGTSYLWVGDNALPENRSLTNANGVGTQVQMVAKTYYPFCIIFTKNGSGDNTFSCNITLPNGNTNNGLGYLFIPHGLAITTPYFWPSIRPIYSCQSTSTVKATSLKFSVDTSLTVPVRLALYNASNVVYDILANVGTSYSNSGNFVAPFSFKLTNNRDLQILDSNGKKYWSLDYMLQTTIDGASSNVVLNYPFPRIGDIVNVGNSVDDRYDGTDARVTDVSYNDRSITVSFFGDDTTRSNSLLFKPAVRDRLITDHGTIYSQDDIFVSDLELAQLHSPNGWFSTTLDTNGIFRVVDNRNGRKTMWASDPLYYDDYTGTVVNKTFTYKINKLNIDITGVLFINADVTITISRTITSGSSSFIRTTSTIVPNYLFPITDTKGVDKTLLVSPYSLILQNNGNMVINNANSVTIWQTNTSVTNVWQSASVSNPVFQVHDMSYLIYPNFVSQNGQYSLTLTNNVLGVYNQLTNALVSGRNIAKPLFYSGSIANGGISTTGAVDCGTLAANNSSYWAKAYTWVTNNISDTSLVNKIGWIWTRGDATTVKIAGSTPTFTTVYNNPSTSSISAILYVSTIEKSLVKMYNINNPTVNNTKDITLSIPNFATSATWGNVYSSSITLLPGATTFTFTSYNSGGRCGLAFWCLPTTISSCDLQLNNSGGQLMLKNIGIRGLDSNGITTSVPGIIQDYAFSSSSTVAGPYIITLNDNGSFSIVNNQGSTYFSTPAATSSPLLLKDVLYVYPSSLGKLLGGQNLLPPGAYDDFSQYLWSPNGNFFFGIVSDFFTFADDTVDASGNVTDALGNDAYYVGAIFDVRFNKPVYTFSNARILASAMARPYITLSSNGVLTGYNNGASLWTVGTASTSTGCYLLLDDTGTLSIYNSTGSVISSYNDSKNYDNFMLSNSITNSKKTFSRPASGFLRLLTSSNGNYTLTFNSDGSLTINYVDIALNNVDLVNDDVKDINVFTRYKTIVNSAQTIVFDSDGCLKVYTTSLTTGTPSNTFGSNLDTYSLVPGYYKLVLENSGNLAIYDSQLAATAVSDLGNITFNSNPTTSYNSVKTTLLNGYTNAAAPVAFQNYRWIWDSDDSTGTVNFYTTYKNTRTAFDAFIYVYCFDGVDIYMNGTKVNTTVLKSTVFTLGGNSSESNQGLGGVRVTIPGNSVSVFKFVATNNNNGPTGLIFWCVDITGLTLGINTTVTVYNITNKTLFYSNPDTVYCSDKVVMGIEEFGFQTWSSGTAYSETVAYGNYDIDKSTIHIKSLRSIEHTFLIPGQKLFCPNGLYYLLFETDGSLSVYLTSSDPAKKLWSNKKPYTGVDDAARLQYVYNADGSGTFGLYDSRGVVYNNTLALALTGGVSYVFTLDNDLKMRLRGSDGSNRVFSP